MQSGLMTLLWLAVVLALIPVSLWLLKRSGFRGLHAAATGATPMKMVSQLSLGPGQRVVTVEVGEGEQRCTLVLGVSPQSIQTLHHMRPSGTPFAETLRQVEVRS